jgi:hypothetical protein
MITYGTYAVPRADLGEAFHEFDPEGMTFIADQILVPYGVPKEQATITVITRENMRNEETLRAEGGTFQRIDITGEDLAYLCKNYGMEVPITDTERRRYVDDFQVELEKIAVLRMRMKIAREIRVKNLIFNTTTWAGGPLFTDVSTDWDNVAADIIADVVAAKEKVRSGTGVKPNALIVGETTVNNLIKNTAIKARFQQTVLLTVDLLRSQMASLFGLQKLIVGDAVYNTADEGQTYSGSDIWPDDYAMVAKLAEGPGSPITTPCIGRTLKWNQMEDNVDGVPEQYREEQTKSEIYRVEDYLQEKIFDPYFAHLMLIDT